VPSQSWSATGLSARIIRQHDGKIRLTYAHPPELLDLTEAGIATDGQTVLRAGQGALWMDRPQENFSAKLAPVSGEPNLDVAGHYRCVELNAELTLINAGGVLYGAFSGFLGQGRMELLDPLATDLWTLPCPRALDHTPPGDWTLHISRDAAGLPVAVTVGCWLARNLRYERLSAPS
jgi:D-aminopeptidase